MSIPNTFVFDLGGVLITHDYKSILDSFCVQKAVKKDKMEELYFSYLEASLINKAITSEIFYNSSGQDEISKLDWLDFLQQLYGSEAVNQDLINWMINNPGIKYYVLTNNTGGIEKTLESKFGIRKYFKAIINSADIGVKKPQQEAFTYALEKIREPAQNCVFVDDGEKNIAEAKTLGFFAILYRNFPQFSSEAAQVLK